MLKKSCRIQNKLGLHARASMKLLTAAGRFQSQISLQRGQTVVDAKDIIQLMSLGAGPGTEVTIITEGPDEVAALEALGTLIDNRFDEDG